jgi:hypothetical protein
MVPGELFVFPAARAIERGLPPIGFQMAPPPDLMVSEISPAAASGAVVRAEERGASGQLVGWMEIGPFSASLLIDRAGVLRDTARSAAQAALIGPARARLLGEGEVEFAGGTDGCRVDLLLQLDDVGLVRPECPYGSWLALAGGDVMVGGGLSVQVRSAGPTWPGASSVLDSLEIAGSADTGPRLELPLVQPD